MTSLLRPALSLFVILSIITGIAYPLLTALIARPLFAVQAGGSLRVANGQTVGSDLIGQAFTDPGHFWSRPSATTPLPYDGTASGGSNLGPRNPALVEAVQARVAALRAADPGNDQPVPVDLVTASASGLDPDISLAAARYQVPRIARHRRLPPEAVMALVDALGQDRQWGLFGEPHVNVLELNLALDKSR